MFKGDSWMHGYTSIRGEKKNVMSEKSFRSRLVQLNEWKRFFA